MWPSLRLLLLLEGQMTIETDRTDLLIEILQDIALVLPKPLDVTVLEKIDRLDELCYHPEVTDDKDSKGSRCHERPRRHDPRSTTRARWSGNGGRENALRSLAGRWRPRSNSYRSERRCKC